MFEKSRYTTEESLAALAVTVEEIEEMESQPKEPLPPIGKYGSLFGKYMRDNHPGRYEILLMDTTLRDVCRQVDTEAKEMMSTITNQLREKTPRPRGDFMATVQYETAIRDQAEEVVLREIVYKRR